MEMGVETTWEVAMWFQSAGGLLDFDTKFEK